jgi:hypothetical protein
MIGDIPPLPVLVPCCPRGANGARGGIELAEVRTSTSQRSFIWPAKLR